MFFNLTIKMLSFLLTINIICYAQERGGPYTSDTNTVLLMHFDDDLILTGQVTDAASAITNPPVYNSSMANFGKCLYLNNEASSQCIVIPGSADLNLGNDWTVEMWIKIGINGSGDCEYPYIFIKDGDGFSAIVFRLDKSMNGFSAGVTLEDGAEININQNSPVVQDKWYHLCLVSDSEEQNISFVIRDEDWLPIFKESRSFPDGNTGNIYHDDSKQVLIGGVTGGSNIQFDGWIDELRISNYSIDLSVPLPSMSAGSSLAEFYAEGQNTNYWSDVSTYIDDEIMELLDYWERPSLTPLLNEGEKIKIYLSDKSTLIDYAGSELPDWKLGAYNVSDKSICLAIPDNWNSENYYGSFEALLKGTLGQLVLKLRFERDNNSNIPEYFMEAFGLYRGGFRPDINNMITQLNNLGRDPVISDIDNTSDIADGTIKDLAVSYIEAQLLTIISYQRVAPGTGVVVWQRSLPYFYNTDDQQRIKLRFQTDHFDMYLAEKDMTYIESIANKLEEKLQTYSNLFEMTTHNKFNCVIYPDAEAGIQCNYTDMYNGGSGWGGDKLDILSPDYFEGGLEGVLNFLIPHEFFHVFHFHMLPNLFAIPAYYFEGLANYLAQGPVNPSTEDDLWKIEVVFDNFNNKFHREPTFSEILNNTYANDPDIGNIDCYFFGETFYTYYLSHGGTYINLKHFFNSVCVWDYLGIPYDEFEAGYIQYLKEIAGISTGIDEVEDEIPTSFNLSQNYPNPFNASTIISYYLPESSLVKLSIYNLNGELVETLVENFQSAGYHSLAWNADNVSSGLYFYRIETGNFHSVKKCLLIK